MCHPFSKSTHTEFGRHEAVRPPLDRHSLTRFLAGQLPGGKLAQFLVTSPAIGQQSSHPLLNGLKDLRDLTHVFPLTQVPAIPAGTNECHQSTSCQTLPTVDCSGHRSQWSAHQHL